MKISTMIILSGSVFFTSCAGVGHFAQDRIGIHDQRTKWSMWSANSFTRSRSPDGFLPAPVSRVKDDRVASLPRDKHGMPTYLRDSSRHRVVRTTAYSHMEMEPGAPWKKSAFGTYLKYGQVRSAAADWSRYPVGTKFKIKGLPYTYVVDDYGSALVGTNTVDIYHPTLRSMKRWGTRYAEITVIQWGSLERTVEILRGRRHYDHTRRMYYAAKARLDRRVVAAY
jgi:3D (Asp-Asp-Asp) domain-containing protein